MSEREVDQRRNWKAETFPYDYFTVEPGKECQYCLTEKQAELLRGIIEPVGWRTRWWSETDQPIDPETIREFRDDLARRLMMSCCCDDQTPVQYRYTSDGVLQRSTDGGTTWEDAPEYDPRNYSPQFPPVPGSDGIDKKCSAATGATMLVKQQVGDQLTDDMSRYTLGQLISDWVNTMIDSSNIFTALVTVIANQIFALVIATLRPALTDDVYHTFQCILYCHMSNSVTFDQSTVDLVRFDITDQISGIAGIFLEHLVYLLGVTGLQNLCRSAPTDGDCSDCDCDYCYLWDFSISNGNWYTNPTWPGGGGAGATYAGGWNSAHPGGSAADDATLYIVYDLPATLRISYLVITYVNSGLTHSVGDGTGMTDNPSPFTAVINADRTQLLIYCYDDTGAGSMSISSIEAHSPNEFPPEMTGGDNC